jgi:hypothetical protein
MAAPVACNDWGGQKRGGAESLVEALSDCQWQTNDSLRRNAVKNKWACFRLPLTLATALLLAACVTPPGPKFSGLGSVAAESAELVVYRKEAFFAAGQTMPVTVDGREIGELYNGSFLTERVAPGNHAIKVSTGPASQSVEKSISVGKGERKFLHFDFPTGPFANVFFIGVTLDERDAQTALADLNELSGAR